MSEIIERARMLRAKIEALATEHLTDQEAEEFSELLPVWRESNEGIQLKKGNRIVFEGKILKVTQDTASVAVKNPIKETTVFNEIGVIQNPVGVPEEKAFEKKSKG